MIMFIHNICIALSGFGSCITVDSVISVSAAILLMKLSKKRSENSKHNLCQPPTYFRISFLSIVFATMFTVAILTVYVYFLSL